MISDLILPEYTTPAELAEHFGLTERHVRELARKIGACTVFGNKMIITKADVQLIMEWGRPTPIQPMPPIHISPVTGRPVIGDAYEELLRHRKKDEQKEQKKKEAQKKLREKSKQKRGYTASTNRGRA